MLKIYFNPIWNIFQSFYFELLHWIDKILNSNYSDRKTRVKSPYGMHGVVFLHLKSAQEIETLSILIYKTMNIAVKFFAQPNQMKF